MDEKFFFGGLDAKTGRPLRAPISIRELAQLILEQVVPTDPIQFESELLGGLDEGGSPSHWQSGRGEPPSWVDAKQVASSGWGVVFPEPCDPGIRRALSELLDYRESQTAASGPRLFRELTYRHGEDLDAWLSRHGVGPGVAEPSRMPFYLLLVGSPFEIPYEFEFRLASQAAVGRIYFEHLAGYSAYAKAVIDAETRTLRKPEAVFFGVQNPGDIASERAVRHLLEPVFEILKDKTPAWELTRILHAEATKARLIDLLERPESPSVLFTTSHGLAPNAEDPDLPGAMGSLVCRDWDGEMDRPVSPAVCFGAVDVPNNADLRGLVVINLACFSLGAPERDRFAETRGGDGLRPKDLIRHFPQPQVARLPQRLLSHEGGGALAVVGHVDRAFGLSGVWPGLGSRALAFASTLHRLLDRYPIGSAMRFLVAYHHSITGQLNDELLRAYRGEVSDDRRLCSLYLESLEMQSYGIFGDPAASLNAGTGTSAEPK